MMPDSRNTTLSFCGYKIRTADIRACLLKLTDLSNALHSFSVRVVKNEVPRRKMIIDVEMAEGYDPSRYPNDTCLYEVLSRLRRMHRSMRDFIKNVPAESFPELYFHAYGSISFDVRVFRTRFKFIF